MGETNYATGGLARISRFRPVVNVRLVVFALAVGLGVLLILWLQARIGSQMVHLEEEFAALKAEAFYVGVQTRVRVRRLNDALLVFHLGRDPQAWAAFQAEAADLRRWLAEREVSLSTPEERALFDAVEAACERYVKDIEQDLLPGDSGVGRKTFAAVYERVDEQSKPLLGLIGRFLETQEQAFDSFLQSSQNTLVSLHRLLLLSLGLLVAAGVVLAGLVYRGMIAPLRQRLSESEAIITRQEKLASLGTLAAGVAHEIRNPLTAIKFRLFSLKQALPSPLADHEDVAVIGSEIDRLDRIVKQFLQFARPPEPGLARVSTEQLLREVTDLLAPQLAGSGVTLRLASSDPLWVFADAQQMKQVLINLVQNAADSIEQEGQITLRAVPGRATLEGSSRPAAILSVTDTGQGIPPEVEQRLFDPFFTTKEDGTGLGLAIAARIVEKHGGLLRYRTVLKQGTTFEMVLPRIEDHASDSPDH